MNKLRNFSRRGSYLAVAVVFLASWLGTVQFVAFADTFFTSEFANRILLLSSSSPGWAFTDGAGNTTFAQPGSGPNGQKTAEQFSFKTNSNNNTGASGTAIKAFTFQYCTAAAGNCKAPGNDGYASGSPGTGDTGYVTPGSDCTSTCVGRNADSVNGQVSDLNITFASASEAASGVVGGSCGGSVLVLSTDGTMCGQPAATTTGANFVVLENPSGTWTYSGGWSANVVSKEDGTHAAGQQTGKNNYITLSNSTGITDAPAGTPMEIIFFATNTNYITNPGKNAFFVKMSDYSAFTGSAGSEVATANTLMDGGVTVANVMTQSIQITTKVLETMSFSVGITDPYTQAGTHGGCDPLLGTSSDFPGGPTNGIALGNQALEYSLSTTQASDGWSLWRLSTNSANGGTVYYSGDTLRSTENTTITPIGTTAKQALAGSNQFGLGLDTTYPTYLAGVFTSPAAHTYYDLHPLDASYGTQYQTSQSGSDPWTQLGLDGMSAMSPYDLGGSGGGSIAVADGATGPSFAYASNANTSPQPIANKAGDVIKCATGQVRYLADVAGYTAAGIYTTKINYLAAPEY